MINQGCINDKIELINQVQDFNTAKKIQERYSSLLKRDHFKILTSESWNSIEKIAAVDISYFSKKTVEYGIACAIMWDFRENKMIEVKVVKDIISFPYIPGYLAFREVPLIIKTLKALTSMPDIILCDGHGIIHPLKFGEATHLGYALDIPSIGIAKNPFFGTSNWKSIKKEKGVKEPIIKNGELLGYALCLTNNLKPIFISTGYKIDIELCIKIALYLSKSHRQPEPLFFADNISRKELKKISRN